MFKIISKTFRTGVVTTKYPDEKEIAPENFRGMVEFDPEKCTFCGNCASECPPGVIRLSHENDLDNLSISHCGCIFCGRCEEVCPDRAVKLTREYEMASRKKHDLITEIKRTHNLRTGTGRRHDS